MTQLRTKVSVVMACYNAADYLDEAIASILNQTMADFDFIIVDDGSQDLTAEIIKGYAAKDRRIVFRAHQKNLGPASARNTAIESARGKYIAVLDSDDIALPERLEAQLKAAGKAPDVILFGSGAISIDSRGCVIKEHKYPATDAALRRRLRRIMTFPPHSSILYRTEEVKRAGGFNPRFIQSEDWDLWLRLAERGNIACLEKPLVKLRRHAGNMSHDDAGKSQILTGTAAVVCHFIRAKGIADPSRQSDHEWRQFTEWLALQLDERKSFERSQEWVRLRQAYYSSKNGLLGAFRLIAEISWSKQGLRMVRERLIGTTLCAVLADEWVRVGMSGRARQKVATKPPHAETQRRRENNHLQ